MFFICRNDLNKLELISSTEKQCLWKKHKQPVLEQFEAQPTKTFCCIKQNRMPDFSVEVQENIRNRLIECNEKTALAKHRYMHVYIDRIMKYCLSTKHLINSFYLQKAQ